jgi:hypothetical protein
VQVSIVSAGLISGV